MCGTYRYVALLDWETPEVSVQCFKRLDMFQVNKTGLFMQLIASFALPGVTGFSDFFRTMNQNSIIQEKNEREFRQRNPPRSPPPPYVEPPNMQAGNQSMVPPPYSPSRGILPIQIVQNLMFQRLPNAPHAPIPLLNPQQQQQLMFQFHSRFPQQLPLNNHHIIQQLSGVTRMVPPTVPIIQLPHNIAPGTNMQLVQDVQGRPVILHYGNNLNHTAGGKTPDISKRTNNNASPTSRNRRTKFPVKTVENTIVSAQKDLNKISDLDTANETDGTSTANENTDLVQENATVDEEEKSILNLNFLNENHVIVISDKPIDEQHDPIDGPSADNRDVAKVKLIRTGGESFFMNNRQEEENEYNAILKQKKITRRWSETKKTRPTLKQKRDTEKMISQVLEEYEMKKNNDEQKGLDESFGIISEEIGEEAGFLPNASEQQTKKSTPQNIGSEVANYNIENNIMNDNPRETSLKQTSLDKLAETLANLALDAELGEIEDSKKTNNEGELSRKYTDEIKISQEVYKNHSHIATPSISNNDGALPSTNVYEASLVTTSSPALFEKDEMPPKKKRVCFEDVEIDILKALIKMSQLDSSILDEKEVVLCARDFDDITLYQALNTDDIQHSRLMAFMNLDGNYRYASRQPKQLPTEMFATLFEEI